MSQVFPDVSSSARRDMWDEQRSGGLLLSITEVERDCAVRAEAELQLENCCLKNAKLLLIDDGEHVLNYHVHIFFGLRSPEVVFRSKLTCRRRRRRRRLHHSAHPRARRFSP